MEYLVEDWTQNNVKYMFSYSELKNRYQDIKNYTNEEFVNHISDILHTTIFICYIKEVPSYICLSDSGIIHELCHILNGIELSKNHSLEIIRDMWNTQCRL